VTETHFSPADLTQMQEKGIPEREIRRQIGLFSHPPPPARLLRPCTIGDGIVRLAPEEHPRLLARWEEAAAFGRLSKFVPASGSASRMFEDLDTTDGRQRLLDKLFRLPFYGELAAACRRCGWELSDATPAEVRRALLGPAGLDYGSLPKGLILFHRYGGEGRTAFEEHLVEAAEIVRDRRRAARIHFTVAPENEARFRALLAASRERLEKANGVHLDVTLSHQRSGTDTIAVDMQNAPFRTADGKLLFRPGGHGALLSNLEALSGDIVFIKNIDNVQRGAAAEAAWYWKRLLAGYLVSLENEARAIGQPIRVCGVVANTGEPGGGPFWVEGLENVPRPQIVESAQVDFASETQKAVSSSSTHFNPVDIVCSLRDAEGRPYRLADFVDPTAVFISKKTKSGMPLKALEHPGLWNGAMAGWRTVFVEVPAETFTPVKTVFDLLRAEHQEE
jgi:hypothetical protein